MNGYILDTNIVTSHLNRNPLVVQRMRQAVANGDPVMLNAAPYYETRRGLLFPGAQVQLAAFEQLWQALGTVMIDQVALDKAAEIYACSGDARGQWPSAARPGFRVGYQMHVVGPVCACLSHSRRRQVRHAQAGVSQYAQTSAPRSWRQSPSTPDRSGSPLRTCLAAGRRAGKNISYRGVPRCVTCLRLPVAFATQTGATRTGRRDEELLERQLVQAFAWIDTTPPPAPCLEKYVWCPQN